MYIHSLCFLMHWVSVLQAMKQVKALGKWFSASFLFSFFKWFFSFSDSEGLCSGMGPSPPVPHCHMHVTSFSQARKHLHDVSFFSEPAVWNKVCPAVYACELALRAPSSSIWTRRRAITSSCRPAFVLTARALFPCMSFMRVTAQVGLDLSPPLG